MPKKIILLLIVCILFPVMSHAFPIAAAGTEGLSIIVSSTDDVIATYRGNSAAYSNDLYFGTSIASIAATSVFVFNNHSSSVGSTVNLGSFDVGTELFFRLHVNNTGYDYYTGDASRNPDEIAHARVQENWMLNETLVSFEDLYRGPFHYNDLSFSFTNTDTSSSTVPEPATMILLGSGLVGLAGFRRKFRKN